MKKCKCPVVLNEEYGNRFVIQKCAYCIEQKAAAQEAINQLAALNVYACNLPAVDLALARCKAAGWKVE